MPKTSSFRSLSRLQTEYEDHILQNKWQPHPRQLKVVSLLDSIDQALRYQSSSARRTDISGAYIHGGTGSGKTMILDMFYKTVTTSDGLKCRFHFLTFMLDIHKRLHRHRLQKHKFSLLLQSEPLEVVATDFVKENGKLLCLDEFQVTDVADAMILKTLFIAMWRQGVVVIATSNRDPTDLYLGGLNRSVFMPFIPLLQSKCAVLDMSDTPDYRTMHSVSMTKNNFLYLTPLNEDTHRRMQSIWLECVAGREVTSVDLSVEQGRSITIPLACLQNSQENKLAENKDTTFLNLFNPGNVCFFSFQELCCVPIGAADYLAIAKRFDTVIISDIPFLSAAAAVTAGGKQQQENHSSDDRNTLRRFISLIDVLYDAKIRLICSAAATPCGLFTPATASCVDDDVGRMRSEDIFIADASSDDTTNATEQFYLSHMNNTSVNVNIASAEDEADNDSASSGTIDIMEKFYMSHINNTSANENVGNSEDVADDDSSSATGTIDIMEKFYMSHMVNTTASVTLSSTEDVAVRGLSTTEQFYSSCIPRNNSHLQNNLDISSIKSGANISVSAVGGSSGRSHTIIGDGNTEWSATGLTGVNMADLNPRLIEDEAFAFSRTVSRLQEMQSAQYFRNPRHSSSHSNAMTLL